MSNLAYLGLAVGLSVVGLVALWLARRRVTRAEGPGAYSTDRPG